MEKASVLIVERDMATRDRLVQALQTRGYAAWGCPTSSMAIDFLPAVQPTMVIVDIDNDAEKGWELLKEVKKTSLVTRVIVNGEAISDETKERGAAAGADAVVLKNDVLHPIMELAVISPKILE